MGGHWRDSERGSGAVTASYNATVTSHYEKAHKSYAKDLQTKVRAECAVKASDAIARGPGRFPAFLSICIECDEEPSGEVFAVLAGTAFTANDRPGMREWSTTIKPTCVRLVRKTTTVEYADITRQAAP